MCRFSNFSHWIKSAEKHLPTSTFQQVAVLLCSDRLWSAKIDLKNHFCLRLLLLWEALDVFFYECEAGFVGKQQVSWLNLHRMSEVNKLRSSTQGVHGSHPSNPESGSFLHNTSAGCHNKRPSSPDMCVRYGGRFGWYVNACHWWFVEIRPQL